jgi:hypothetical protein
VFQSSCAFSGKGRGAPKNKQQVQSITLAA